MKLRMPLRRWLAGWLVLAMLFAQLASAAYACPTGAATASALPCGMGSADGASMTRLDPDQPGLCLQHCQAPSQALDQGHSPSVPTPAPAPALALAPADPGETASRTLQDRRRDRAPPPAHSILHCCYRI